MADSVVALSPDEDDSTCRLLCTYMFPPFFTFMTISNYAPISYHLINSLHTHRFFSLTYPLLSPPFSDCIIYIAFLLLVFPGFAFCSSCYCCGGFLKVSICLPFLNYYSPPKKKPHTTSRYQSFISIMCHNHYCQCSRRGILEVTRVFPLKASPGCTW